MVHSDSNEGEKIQIQTDSGQEIAEIYEGVIQPSENTEW
jgi:hypothetical protein